MPKDSISIDVAEQLFATWSENVASAITNAGMELAEHASHLVRFRHTEFEIRISLSYSVVYIDLARIRPNPTELKSSCSLVSVADFLGVEHSLRYYAPQTAQEFETFFRDKISCLFDCLQLGLFDGENFEKAVKFECEREFQRIRKDKPYRQMSEHDARQLFAAKLAFNEKKYSCFLDTIKEMGLEGLEYFQFEIQVAERYKT